MRERAEGEDYAVGFPDLPGCTSAGRTLEEAHRMAVEALALYLDVAEEEDLPVAPLRELDALRADGVLPDGTLALAVPAPEADPSE